jgi:hypothetical protein
MNRETIMPEVFFSMISRKSIITFGMVAIPISMYTATQDNDIRFNQLHKEDNSRIRYKKTCSHCGKEIKAEDIVKGYHVVVPLKPGVSWEVFHDFARSVAHVMENKWPNQYTSNIRKNKRKNKIFIDWIRNARGATSIAPYSLRARKGGKVSMPIFWDELDTVAPDGIDIFDALSRIEGADPWEDFFNNSQTLKAFT